MDLGLVAALAVGVVKAPVEEGCPVIESRVAG